MPAEKQKLCFVLMPFSDRLKDVYDEAIRPACLKAGFDSLRVDELKGAFNINRKIIENIFSSDAIIADLTEWNPNVFYEMGVAHAIDNKTIMIAQRGGKLPFDVSGYNCVMYDHTEAGLGELKSNITEFLLDFDEWCKYPTNPVQEFKPQNAFVSQNVLRALREELIEQQAKVSKLQKELNESHSSNIFMEETSLDPLLWHIRYRRKKDYKKNPVELDYLGLNCKITENRGKFDVDMIYRIRGKNIQDQALPGLQLIVAGDNPVPFLKLNPKLYLLSHTSKRHNFIKPELLSSDGKLKVIFLPFLSPGIEKNGVFSIEFSLRWPNLVWSESPKDYFFLDNFDYEKGTHELQMNLEFQGINVGTVNAFVVDSSLREQRLGSILSDDRLLSKFVFNKTEPENDKYYILAFDFLRNSEVGTIFTRLWQKIFRVFR